MSARKLRIWHTWVTVYMYTSTSEIFSHCNFVLLTAVTLAALRRILFIYVFWSFDVDWSFNNWSRKIPHLLSERKHGWWPSDERTCSATTCGIVEFARNISHPKCITARATQHPLVLTTLRRPWRHFPSRQTAQGLNWSWRRKMSAAKHVAM